MTDKSKICSDCKEILCNYLGIAGDQDDLIRLIASLTEGVVSDEGLDRDDLARLGGFLKDYLTRRGALNNFFLGEPEICSLQDQAVAQSELAFIRARLGLWEDETERSDNDQEDPRTKNPGIGSYLPRDAPEIS